MIETLETLLTYQLRVAPALLLGLILIYATRKEPRLRIIFYLAAFVLLRDAMTPLNLWSFGTQGFFWIRLRNDPLFLELMGLACLGLSLALYYFDRENRPLFRWVRGSVIAGVATGVLGIATVVAPLAAIYRYTPITERGGVVPMECLPALLIATLFGNLLEEALFRGYVFGHLAERMSPLKAGITSGFVFAFCHIFLASTVTGIGYPLLAFTLWEGIIAGMVGARYGVIPAALTHGGAIFLLSSGLI